VIKRITFATRARGLPPDAFAATSAPDDARPARVTVCTALPGLGDGEPEHDVIGFEWFTDVAHVERFEGWLEAEGSRIREPGTGLVADELVLRGADWLEQRWRDGGERLKHMAIALRARDLTPTEFSERWRNHAGRVGRAGAPAIVIPDSARGQAYVQNHPRPRPAGDWPYDAVNEVYFDDLAGLQTRIDWFRENVEPEGDDLVRASWFVAASEEVLIG
jgi:EthD domain